MDVNYMQRSCYIRNVNHLIKALDFKMRLKLFIPLLLTILVSINSWGQSKYEMRGVWVATVANIDWPSNPNLSTKAQKSEIIKILDNCEALKLNAIFLQVRSCGDALYKSSTEPWSKFLTGKQGIPPTPYYDPLHYWIEEAHKRGIELHAWINPYRVSMERDDKLFANHVANRHRNWVIEYGGKRYLNPGEPEVVNYIKYIVNELITKYQIDGIHLDDYFYPYPINGESFDDEWSFKRYGFNYQNIDDWRRDNVNIVVESIHKTIKLANKGVKFGISPFGIWRNNSMDLMGSDTEGAITNYDDLYADVLEWIKNGWLDYIAPQLYWDLNHKKANYATLLQWWRENSGKTPLFIGESLYKINAKDKNWSDKNEMKKHIELCRSTSGNSGNIFFSVNHFNRDLHDFQSDITDSLYLFTAIPPYFHKGDLPNSTVVKIKKKRKGIIITELNRDIDRGSLNRFGVYRFNETELGNYPYSKNLISITYGNKISLPKVEKSKIGRFGITYIAPNGQESPLSNIIEIKGR